MTIYWTIVLINTFAVAGSLIAFQEKTTACLCKGSGQVDCRTRRSELGSHSHQVSEGVGPRLLHDAASMRLNRDFANPELAANLFVQQARNY